MSGAGKNTEDCNRQEVHSPQLPQSTTGTGTLPRRVKMFRSSSCEDIRPIDHSTPFRNKHHNFLNIPNDFSNIYQNSAKLFNINAQSTSNQNPSSQSRIPHSNSRQRQTQQYLNQENFQRPNNNVDFSDQQILNDSCLSPVGHSQSNVFGQQTVHEPNQSSRNYSPNMQFNTNQKVHQEYDGKLFENLRPPNYDPLQSKSSQQSINKEQRNSYDQNITEPQISTTMPPKEKKEKKSITTKTFAHGLMDVSLLTSNASQLRSVLSNPDHEFYELLIWLISISVILQVLSGVLLVMSDFLKTQVKETDRLNMKKRKTLNFISLAMVMVITSLNVLISAFYSPSMQHYGDSRRYTNQKSDIGPTFAASDYHSSQTYNHTEL